MAAPFEVNLTIYQGATFRQSVTWKSGTPAAPVDLTGCTARMQIREKVDSATVLATFTTEDGGITLGAALGTVEVFASDETTAGYTFTRGVYDLEVEFVSGEVRRLMAGKVTVSPEVTRV